MVTSAGVRLTTAELSRLTQAAWMIDRGAPSAVWALPRGWLATAVRRTCERLCDKGLMKAYVHGGFEITEAGRAVLAASAPAQPEAARPE